MSTIIKKQENITVDNGDKLHLVIDTGFACSGDIEVSYFNTDKMEMEPLGEFDVSDEQRVKIPAIKKKTKIAVYGRLARLPGKKEVRLTVWLYDDLSVVQAIRTESELFSIVLDVSVVQ